MKNLTFALLFSFLLLISLINDDAFGQVKIGTTTYTTLKAAFDRINDGTHTGDVAIKITGNTTETASAVLYQSGYGGLSSYTSVSLFPEGSGYVITGYIAGPLVEINGADKVTIDGRVNGSGSIPDLTFQNTCPDAGTGYNYASTIRIINSAEKNTVKYCYLKGSANYKGVVHVAGSASGNGNDDNTITNCKITKAGTIRPFSGILLDGVTSPVNDRTKIISNEIYDIFAAEFNSSSAIKSHTGNQDILIDGNSIYEPSSLSLSYTLKTIRAIDLECEYATVTNNSIGGQSANCGGGQMEIISNRSDGTELSFTGIMLSVGKQYITSVQGNTIRNIKLQNTYSPNPFNGIYIWAGKTDIGSVKGNTIGASTGTGSITVIANDKYIYKPTSYGIRTYEYAEESSIVNNTIGSINCSCTNTTPGNSYGHSFTGIYCGMGRIVKGNLVGSLTTEKSIECSSEANATQVLTGLASGADYTVFTGNTVVNLHNNASLVSSGSQATGIRLINGYSVITDNTIRNISNKCGQTSASENASVVGILCSRTPPGTNLERITISSNKIYDLKNIYPNSSAVHVYGILLDTQDTLSCVRNNFIYNLGIHQDNGSSSAQIRGILFPKHSSNTYNNIINLGTSNDCNHYGIYVSGVNSGLSRIWSNTVYVGGSVQSGGANTAALYQAGTTGTFDFRNNILVSERTKNSGSAKFYTIYLSGTAGLTLNYNDYYASGNGSLIGFNGTMEKTSIPVVTGQDANSKTVNPQFSGSLDNPDGFVPGANLPGETISNVFFDYFGNKRGSAPKMGAVESLLNNKVKVFKGGSLQASYGNLKSAFDKINNGTHKGALTIKLTETSIETSSAVLMESGTGNASYSSVSIYPSAAGVEIIGDFDMIPVIELNGADSVIIDGRVNQTGDRDMVIANLSRFYYVTQCIQLGNGAANNSIRYCTLKGSIEDSLSGIVFFNKSVKLSGNSNNRIEQCEFKGANGKPSWTALFSEGEPRAINTGNIMEKNIFCGSVAPSTSETRFFSQCIWLRDYNTGWIITGNVFYEPAENNSSSQTYHAIRIGAYKYAGTDYYVTDNKIGGNSSDGSGKLTFGSSSLGLYAEFKGITISAGTGSQSVIRNNTIKNITINGTALTNPFTGIRVYSGNVLLADNTIGETGTTGSITIRQRETAVHTSYGIMISDPDGTSQNIIRNRITSFSLEEKSGVASKPRFYGIFSNSGQSGSKLKLRENMIGDEVSNAVQLSATGTESGLYGIYSSGNNGNDTIAWNRITNLTNNSQGSQSRLTGIYTSGQTTGASYSITDNYISELNSSGNNTGTGQDAVLQGITALSPGTTQNITGNTVCNLKHNYSSASAVTVNGVFFKGASSGSNSVSGNFIHTIKIHSSNSSTSAVIRGVSTIQGSVTFSNNIISLGGINNNCIVNGFYENCPSGNFGYYYYNTVYLGGTVTGSSAISAAFLNGATTNSKVLRNNILVNARTNSGGTGKHYALRLAGTSGMIISYNDYYVSGTGGVPGFDGTSDKTSLPLLSNQDAGSVLSNPSFSNGGGTTASGYLPSTNLYGTSNVSIYTDYFRLPRTIPTMGALEKSYLIWTGTQSTTWNLGENWSSGTVPGPETNALIPAGKSNYPLIESSAEIHDLAIESGASVSVAPNYNLTVAGTLINKAGTTGLVLKGTSSGSGSLIHDTRDVFGTVERHITGTDITISSDGWHFLSSPVLQASILGDWTPDGAGNNYDLYTWEESSKTWLNQKFLPNKTGEFIKGTGYLVSYQTAGKKTLKGLLNTTGVSFSGLTKTEESTESGWHLLGNPFCSALKWNDGTWNLTNIAGTAKIWNEANRSYSDIGSNGYIPMMNGIMVQVTSGSGSLTIPAGSRVHNTTSWYKSSREKILLIASEADGQSAQESQILFNDQSTEGFDAYFDSPFLTGGAASFYSYAGQIKVSTNSFSAADDELVIPFDFIPNQEENFIIRLAESISDKTVYLFDKQTGISQNLSQNPEYRFNSSFADGSGRFLLSFKPSDQAGNTNPSNLRAYYSHDRIYVDFRAENGSGLLEVFSIDSRICFQTGINTKGWNSFSLNLSSGLYLVRLTHENGNSLQTKILVVK